jgi:hypothetical protein
MKWRLEGKQLMSTEHAVVKMLALLIHIQESTGSKLRKETNYSHLSFS